MIRYDDWKTKNVRRPEENPWEDFFRMSDGKDLAFRHQERIASAQNSRSGFFSFASLNGRESRI